MIHSEKGRQRGGLLRCGRDQRSSMERRGKRNARKLPPVEVVVVGWGVLPAGFAGVGSVVVAENFAFFAKTAEIRHFGVCNTTLLESFLATTHTCKRVGGYFAERSEIL